MSHQVDSKPVAGLVPPGHSSPLQGVLDRNIRVNQCRDNLPHFITGSPVHWVKGKDGSRQ